MDRNRLIARAKELFAEDLNDDSVTYYLKEEGADPVFIPGIIETARAEFAEEQAKKFTRLNKMSFYIWLTFTLAVIIFALFVLPRFEVLVNRITIFALLATVVTCIGIFMALSYYKTWHEKYVRKIGRAKIMYPYIAVLWIPGFILYFIYSARISSVQESELKQTQVEVTGHVVGGSSTAVKKLIGGEQVGDISTIIVEFETKDGQKMIVSKPVDATEFKNFYKGEEVHIIYSKTNPHNIDLLDNDSSVREFRGSDERDLEAADLMRLVTLKPADLGKELNKISYGWSYDAGRQLWINEKRQCAVALKDNQLNFVGKFDYNTTYPMYLLRNGFKLVNKEDPTDIFRTGKKIFLSKNFVFNVEAKGMPDSAHAVISVVKR